MPKSGNSSFTKSLGERLRRTFSLSKKRGRNNTDKQEKLEPGNSSTHKDIETNKSETETKVISDERVKTVLLAPLDSHGHINSLVCIANHLKQVHKFETVFLFIEPIENKLESLGHKVYDATTSLLVPSNCSSSEAQLKWNEIIKHCDSIWQKNDIWLSFHEEMTVGFGAMIDDIKKYNDNIREKLKLIKPDLILVDHYFAIPAIFEYIFSNDIPWIRISSAAPLALHSSPNYPPACLGLPTANTSWLTSDDDEAVKQRELATKAGKLMDELYDSYNSYYTSQGLESLPSKPVKRTMHESKWLNLYMYPLELDYEEELVNWVRCDSILREAQPRPFEIPEKLRDLPGKLIYLSLGSLGSACTNLMKRLVAMLADCPHRFIVARGPCANEYELADNMWGEEFVDQLAILNNIDLIITHGGNNTIVESFFFGVPAIVCLPLFADQFDNAVRLEETKLGKRLLPYEMSKEQLLESIESALNDESAQVRLREAGSRMRNAENRDKAVREVDALLARASL